MTNFDNNAHVITAGTMHDALVTMSEHQLPVFIWGSPGIGKSDVVRKVAATRGIECRDIRLVQYDPVDLRGIPVGDMDTMTTKWLTPDNLPTDGAGVMFLDELNAAPALVQAAAYQLILDRKLGEYTLPDGWSVIAAGNLETDRAVTNRMPTALANRFTHFQLGVDVDAWIEWAYDDGVALEVVSFITYQPDLLHVFDPKSNEKRFCTPRSWARVSDILTCNMPPDAEYAAIAGTIGDAAAASFVAFMKTFRKLPNPDTIMADPDNADVPMDDPSTLYAIACVIASRATTKNFDKVYRYAKRMPADLTILTTRNAVTRDRALAETKTYIEFAVAHGDFLI